MMKHIDYKSLFTLLPERYVVFDIDVPKFTMVAASDAYLDITNKNTEQVIGHGLFEVFPDTSDKALKNGKGDLQLSLEKVIATKKEDSTGIIRYDVSDKKGKLQVRYWQATHYPILENGSCVGILQSTADVTEIVNSNEELRLANLKLEDALSAGLIGSWSWDIKKNVVTADKGLAQLFAISEEKALQGLPIDVFVASIYEQDQAMVQKKIELAIETLGKFEAEYRTVDANGDMRWVIARGNVEQDEHGDAAFFPGVMIDISSRKAAETQLRDSEERLRFMADTMPQLVWITRADGYHEYYNKFWYEYTGTTEGDTDGEGWNELFHSEDRDRARKIWSESLKTGDPYEIKYRLYHAPSQEYRWVIGRALPFRDERGKIVKWYGTCTDIHDSIVEIERRKKLETELKTERDRLEMRVNERTSQLRLTNEGLREEIKKRQKVEAKIREYSTELQRSNKELEEFAYVSSHDLQEPLRKIQAFSDLLVDEYEDKLGEGQEYLKRIKDSAMRMSTLIEDLLTFSRVSTKPSLSRPIHLKSIIEDTLVDLQDRIDKEHASIVIDSELPTVMADETHMRQLFQNLLSNALKFHRKGQTPEITVSSVCSANECTIRVADNGIGIDKKYHEKIFAVFQRLNTKQAYEGTGIGLAVCKKIVDRYGGTIKIESELDKGTVFIITMPIESKE